MIIAFWQQNSKKNIKFFRVACVHFDPRDRCGVSPQMVMGKLFNKCAGRQSCVIKEAELKMMFSGKAAPPCGDRVIQVSAIVRCRMAQLPLEAWDVVDPSEFGFVHFEERRLDFSSVPEVALSNAHRMRLVFQDSEYLRYLTPDNFTDFTWGDQERTEAGAPYARRLLTTMSIPKGGGAGGPSFWHFRVRGSKFWADGGRLAIFSPGFQQDACINCDLSMCTPDAEDACEFQAHLHGSAQYTVILWSIARAEEVGLNVSLEFKPPVTCDLKVSCEEVDDPACRAVPHSEYAWQPVAKGAWPWFECATPYNARILRESVEIKPFCVKPDAFGDDTAGCWPRSPGTHASLSSGKGCAGSYHVLDAACTERRGPVYAASRLATKDSKDFQVILKKYGACVMTTGGGASLQIEGFRTANLRFEEGPW